MEAKNRNTKILTFDCKRMIALTEFNPQEQQPNINSIPSNFSWPK